MHMVMLRMKRKKGGERNVLNPKTLNPKSFEEIFSIWHLFCKQCGASYK